MRVLVYGDGQLAQMLNLAGVPLGIDVAAVNVKDHSIVNPVDKAPRTESLKQAITDAKALTVEFEHVPVGLLEDADASGKLHPSFTAIRIGADRVLEKRFLERLQIPNCRHQIITEHSQLDNIVAELGEKVIIKASLDGYDGYGQWRLKAASQLPELKAQLADLDLGAVPLIAEQMVSFERELSLIGARNAQGQVNFYPLAENRHHEGQLHVSVAPAPKLTEELTQQAQQIFTTIVEDLDYVGVLAVEMFQIGERLIVNELAPRVHNSGHWSIHGAETSQFENQLRAVLNLPLGDMSAHSVSAMVNIIGCGSIAKEVLAVPGCHLHWYGKTVRAKRKMGHINVVAESYAQLAQRLDELAGLLPLEFFPVLEDEAQRLAEQ
ncbi:5-(carboxyamino)imidazole ribonucleotide synthase [Alteromonas sp. ASW11-36]|uniref:N5-carboxyaminoimidazole ribonucleotide synthase n=1 Tax=Alteromonas arenosi TaxID=3055817 RepID=A0ABT7SZD9_9ALTE|nr:5-(carboxyamino)imidazole ribonucleotide synthase [Alteromonas sp. ASW11-36]MDM7861552.1 5-(carboxyamino)imidazole ribonucleotide synthase [Alteromonas sp. ASW11-36]